MTIVRGWRLTAVLLLAAGCDRLSDEKAVGVVRGYDRALVEAYRTGDARPLEGWAGPAEKKKVAGLIGVKLDMGITLDAHMLDFKPLAIERRGGAVTVTAAERWYYLDRRIGTAQQVGQDSRDEYTIRYSLEKHDGRWLVMGIDYAAPPRVGRQETMGADVRIVHGFDSLNPDQEKSGRGSDKPVDRKEKP
ncbi:MAG TPA: hypothetical protein VF841_01710 [Anaeromyxobacter sp.]